MLDTLTPLGIFAITGSHEYKMAQVVYDALLPLAFLFSVAGFGWGIYSHQDDIKGLVMTVVTAAFCIGLLASFPAGVMKAQEGFESLGKSIESDIDTFKTAWKNEIPNGEGGSILDDIKCAISWACLNILQGLGFLGYQILFWIQPYFLSILIAFAPLTICMFQVPFTKNIAVTTWITTLGVLLWPVGISVADIFVAKIGIGVFTAFGIALGTAAVVPALAPAILAKMVVAFLMLTIFINLLYLSVPVSIGMILKGGGGAMGAVGAAAFVTASVAPLANQMGKLSQSLKGLIGSLGGSGSSGGGVSAGSSSSGSENFGSSSTFKGLPSSGSNSGAVRPSVIPRGGGGGKPKIGNRSNSLGMGGADVSGYDLNQWDRIQTAQGTLFQPPKLGPKGWADKRNNHLAGIKGIEDGQLN